MRVRVWEVPVPSDVAAALKQDPERGVWLVTGAAALLVERAVASVVEAVLPLCGPPAFNHLAVRLSDGGGVEALAAARTLPMMAGRRLVVVRELEKGDEAFFSALVDYLAEASPSTTLVLCGAGYPKVVKGGKRWGQRVGKVLPAGAFKAELKVDSVRPEGFARDHAASLGHRMPPDAARMLVELVGSDLGLLVQEVEKASLFVAQGAAIDAEAVRQACSQIAEAEVWDLTSGIVGRDPDQALATLHRLLESGEATHRLLALVVWQFRTVLRVAEMMRHKRPDSQIQRELRVRSSVLGRIRRMLRSDFPGAASVLGKLARANRQLNSHRAGDRRVFEALIVELATR